MELSDDKVESLLDEIKDIRDNIGKMIDDLEKLSKKVDTMFPDSISFKARWVFEEKVKATTELFKTLLEMRKEVTKSLKDEIEIRRKLTKGEDFEDFESLFDIRKIAKRVGQFQNQLESQKSQKQNIPNELDFVEIPK